MNLVIFRHPLRSPKTWWLGYEEGNSWTAIARLKVEPYQFGEILNRCLASGPPYTVKVDVSETEQEKPA